MLHLQYKSYELPFEYPFQLSKGIKYVQPTLILFLSMGGKYGLGEATEIKYYNNTIESMMGILENYENDIKKYAYNGPERFWHFLHHLLPEYPFIVSALDIASWDMWSQMQGQKVYEMMGLKWTKTPATDYTLGIDSEEMIVEKIKNHPYSVYKLKVDDDSGKILLETVLKHSKAKIRIDANEAWSKDDFIDILGLVQHDRIELLEQPFHREDMDTLQYAKEKISIPIIADEAICNSKEWKKLGGFYDGLNIKLSKCSGLTPALPLIKEVKADNKKIMLGTMSETMIGSAAIAQLLPLADYADVDGPLLLNENVGKGLNINSDGEITFEFPTGIGVQFH